MKATFDEDKATVVFNPADWSNLMILLGYGVASSDRDIRRMGVRFVNEINKGNPHFTPYEVPAE
jgi:hypothetical protein